MHTPSHVSTRVCTHTHSMYKRGVRISLTYRRVDPWGQKSLTSSRKKRVTVYLHSSSQKKRCRVGRKSQDSYWYLWNVWNMIRLLTKHNPLWHDRLSEQTLYAVSLCFTVQISLCFLPLYIMFMSELIQFKTKNFFLKSDVSTFYEY